MSLGEVLRRVVPRGSAFVACAWLVGCPGPPGPASALPSPTPSLAASSPPGQGAAPSPEAAPPSPSPSPSPSATQTPSASPAGGEGLEGRWAGRRMSLELEAAGPRYEGTLTLRERGIPVTLREREGRWVGVLVQGEVEAEFSVARDEGALVLVSDGRTYRLERAQRVEEAISWVGSYRGPRDTTLQVGLSSDAYAGSLELDGVRYVLAGRIEEAALVGSLRDPLTGKELTWRASDVDAEGLLFTIRLEEPNEEGRASFHALRFERAE